MTSKAYIVANEQQEREVLEKLEREGYLWRGTDMRPTEKHRLIDEPITIFSRDDKRLMFDYGVNEAYLADHEIEIVFDGRKEEQMSEKYVVSQEFMNELEKWAATCSLSRALDCFVDIHDIETLPMHIETWWAVNGADTENNNRLIAIIRWVNGEDVFEVEKPKKWVVRSKELNANGNSHYGVLAHFGDISEMNYFSYDADNATKFDTKEEAESWANAHQEVVSVEE